MGLKSIENKCKIQTPSPEGVFFDLKNIVILLHNNCYEDTI